MGINSGLFFKKLRLREAIDTKMASVGHGASEASKAFRF